MIASKQKRSIRRSVYFVRPALRASRWNGTAVCVKPTQTRHPAQEAVALAHREQRVERARGPSAGSRRTRA